MERLLKSKLRDGRFDGLTAAQSRRMSSIRGKHNRTTELALKMAFVRAGMKGWVLHRKIPGSPDFYFPKQLLAVFVDGCFWHGCRKCGHVPRQNRPFWAAKLKRNRQRDALTNRRLNLQGIKVLRLWEHELKDAARCIAKVGLLLAQTPRSKNAVTAAANHRSSVAENPF